MVRAKQLFDVHWQYLKDKPDFDKISKNGRDAWYRIACEEARMLENNAAIWQEAIDALKAEANTMVPRKHYTDAMKSLSVCQIQIETLMVELRRLDPRNRIAQDASTVLGLLEAMIAANSDMQDEEWKEREKANKAEAERVWREGAFKRTKGALGVPKTPKSTVGGTKLFKIKLRTKK